MTQRVYYDDGTPPWTWWHTKDIDLDHTSAEVAHGYTLCSLDRLSRIAARRTFGGHISYTDRYWLAYSAMSEHLWGWRREQQKARPLPGAGSKGRRSHRFAERGFGVAFQAADLLPGVSEGVGDVGLLDAACSEGADDAAEVESGLSDGGFGLVDSCDGCSEFGHVGLFHGLSVAQRHVANFRYATRG